MALVTSTVVGGNVFKPKKRVQKSTGAFAAKPAAPKTGFDAFFGIADDPNATAATAQKAFDEAPGLQNVPGVAPRLLSDADALTAGLAGDTSTATNTGNVTADGTLVSVLPNEGRVQGDGDGAVVPGENQVVDPFAAYGGINPAFRSANRGRTQGDNLGAVASSEPTVAPQPVGPVLETDKPRIEEYAAEFERDIQKMIASGNFNPDDIARGFRASGSRGVSGGGDAEVRRLLADAERRLLAAQQSSTQGAIPTQPVVTPPVVAPPVVTPPVDPTQPVQTVSTREGTDALAQAGFVGKAGTAGTTAASGLTLPDFTKSGTTARVLSPLEQMLETAATTRLGTSETDADGNVTVTPKTQFIDPDSAEITAAEKFGLDRLEQETPILDTKSFLNTAAEGIATNRGVNRNLLGNDSSGLAKAAEAQLLQRINSTGNSPQEQLRRQQFEKRLSDSERDDTELLNRLGILRSGDSVEALTERNTRRDEGELGLNAFTEQLRDQAINQSLGFVQRGDSVRSREQDLQRGALADLNTLQGRRDSLGLANEDLRQQAFQNTVGLQGRRDDISRDNQDLQRAALGDAAGLVNTRNNLDLNEANLTGSLRGGATLGARQAQGDQEFRRAGFGQDVTDRELSRLRGTLDVGQRESFDEDTRARREQERLAGRADTRAGEALDLQELLSRAGLTGELDGNRTLAGDAGSRAERGLQSDLLTGVSQRNLAGNADTRAREALDDSVSRGATADSRAERGLQSDLLTGVTQRGLAGNADTRAQTALDDAVSRGATADSRSERGLQSDLLSALQSRLSQQGADTRAGRQSIQDILNSIQGRTSQQAADTRAGSADTRAENADDRSERALSDDLLSSILNRTNARNADDRAGQSLEDLLFGTNTSQAGVRQTQGGQDRDLGREATRAGFTGQFEGADTLAERGLTDDLLTSRTNRRTAGNADRRAGQALISDLASASQSRTSQRGADSRADQSLEDVLFGTSGDRRTESGLTNDLNRRNAANADTRAGQSLEDQLFGTSTTQGGTRDTLRGDQADRSDRGFEDDLLTSALGRDATTGSLTGDFQNERTLAGQQQDDFRSDQRISQLLAAAKDGRIDPAVATTELLKALGLGPEADPAPDPRFIPKLPSDLRNLTSDLTGLEPIMASRAGLSDELEEINQQINDPNTDAATRARLTARRQAIAEQIGA